MDGSGARGGGGTPQTRVGWCSVLVALVLAGVVAGRVVAVLLDGSGGSSLGSPAPAPVVAPALPEVRGAGAGGDAPLRRAARVLHAWDADRAAAYARGDPAALRRLYVPGSLAGTRDLRVLRAYSARGLVVRDLRTQLLSLRVLSAGAVRLRLEVTDRRAGGRAVGRAPGTAGRPGTAGTARPVVAVALPQDAPSTRVVEMHRHGQRWQVAAVRDG